MKSRWLLLFFALAACGRHENSAGSNAPSRDSSGMSGGSQRMLDTSMNGGYVNRAYLESLLRNKSIFGTNFPKGAVFLSIRNDTTYFDDNNHDGFSASCFVLNEEKRISDSSQCYLVREKDSGLALWERWDPEFVRFERTGSPRIEDLYAKYLIAGRYICKDSDYCSDTVTLTGDSSFGINRRNLAFKYVIDWADNMPQMDYVVLKGGDTSIWYAYAVHENAMDFFKIDISDSCLNYDDNDCPMYEAKRGKRLFEMKKIP